MRSFAIRIGCLFFVAFGPLGPILGQDKGKDKVSLCILNCREQFLEILLEYQKNVREIFVYEYCGMTYHVLWSAHERCSSVLDTKGQ